MDVDDVISWRERGSGEPVVFLHGLGGSRTAWEPQLASLGDRLRCVAWDMPGYGKSAPIESLTFASIAGAVARLLDAAGIARAHLVGESFGGMHALHTAVRHPDRVHKMVLTNTSPAFGLDGTDTDSWRAARLAPLNDGMQPADFASDVLRAIAGPSLTEEMLQLRAAAFGRILAAGLRAAVNCLVDHDVRSDLAKITAPTLVVAGELDNETPPSYAQALAAGIANAQLVVLDGVGHLAASEAPEIFNDLVRNFLLDPATPPSG